MSKLTRPALAARRFSSTGASKRRRRQGALRGWAQRRRQSDPDWFGGWVANGPNSDWIAPNPQNANNGNITLTLTFSLAGFNPLDATLSGGMWTIDDNGTLTLNGHLLSTLSSGQWASLNSFSIPASDFVDGINTLVIQGTGSDDFLEGGRLEGVVTDNVASATPLPAALPLFAGGIGALGLLGWRRKKKPATLTA